MNRKYLKIKEVSKLYNIGVDSLRYYEEIGLIEPFRGENGYRYYGMRELMLLNIMREYRTLNFSLAEIKDMLEKRSLDTTLSLLQDGINRIDDQIIELRQRRSLIKQRIENIKMFRTGMPYDEVCIRTLPAFKCLHISYEDIHPQDIDLHLNEYLVKSSIAFDDMIGRCDAYRLDPETINTDSECRVKEVLVLNNAMTAEPDMVIPAGNYLIFNSNREFPKTAPMAEAILEYAARYGIETEGDMFEISVFDLYDTDDEKEYLTSVILKIKEERKN